MSFPWTEKQLEKNVTHSMATYFSVRTGQATRQLERGAANAGLRGEVTGGLQMDGLMWSRKSTADQK